MGEAREASCRMKVGAGQGHPASPVLSPALHPAGGSVHLRPAPASPAHRSLTPVCVCLSQCRPHQHPCAGPRAPSACGTRPWQADSGGNSAHGSRWGEALTHSAPATAPGSDSDSAGQALWGHPAPMAKVSEEEAPHLPCWPAPVPAGGAPAAALCPQGVAWDGKAPWRPSRNTRPTPAMRVSGFRDRGQGFLTGLGPPAVLPQSFAKCPAWDGKQQKTKLWLWVTALPSRHPWVMGVVCMHAMFTHVWC